MVNQQPAQTSRQLAVVAALCIAVIALFVWFGFDMVPADMSALYIGGWIAGTGDWSALYTATPAFAGDPALPGWHEARIASGVDFEMTVAYVYPPIWAWALGPVSHALDPMTFFNASRAILAGFYLAAIIGAWRLMQTTMDLPRFLLLAIIVGLLTVPMMFALSLVQPQIIVVALVIWSAERLNRGKDVQAGLLLGLAAAFKVSPILFLILFIAEKEWRACAWAVGTAGGIALLSVAVAGWPAHAAFLETIGTINSLTFLNAGNLTLAAVLQPLFFSDPTLQVTGSPAAYHSVAGVEVLSKLLLLGAAAAVLWATRDLAPGRRVPARLFVLVPVIYFFSPLAWSHYYMPLTILALAAYGILPLRAWLALNAVAVGMFFMPFSLTLANHASIYPLMQWMQTPLLLITVLIFLRALKRGPQSDRPREKQADAQNPAAIAAE